MSYAQSQSYSVSSSSGGGGGGGGGSVQMSMSGGGGGSSGFSSMSGGRGDVSLSSSRKTDITRTSGSRGGGGGQSMLMALSSLGGGTAAYAGTHDLGSNPTSVIANRQREKHDLEDLNKKLADYISSVGYYKAKVKEQEQIIANFKGKFESMEANLRAIYDPEMENLRGTIDATAREKAQVELKVETLENLYKDFRSKYEAELSAHEVTRASVPKLQRELSEKDAQIDFLAKTLSSLEPQVGALKSQISTYQKESIDAKMGADAEIVRRVELESKLVTKEEEIAFLKRLYEEKLRMALDLDMDSADVQAIYSKELGNALCDIRAEYQAQLEAIRQGGGDDSWYQQRFNAMMQTSEKQGRELVMAKEEVVKAKTKYSEAVQSTGAMRNEIASLKAMVDDLQSAMEEEKKAHSVAIGDRDAQCVEYKKQIAAHIMELKGLMDIKLGLDTQIAEYRRLLLSEETRMRGETGSAGGGGGAVTMQSSSSTFSSSGGGSSGMSSGGGSSGFSSGSTMSQSSSSMSSSGGSGASASGAMSQSMARTTFQASSKGKAAISETAADGRYIVVENKQGSTMDFGGWRIERKVDNNEQLTFVFPPGTNIGGFSTMKVWSQGAQGALQDNANLICNVQWGVGFNAENSLRNPAGEGEASLTQRTMLG